MWIAAQLLQTDTSAKEFVREGIEAANAGGGHHMHAGTLHSASHDPVASPRHADHEASESGRDAVLAGPASAPTPVGGGMNASGERDAVLLGAFLRSIRSIVRLRSERDLWDQLGLLLAAHSPATWSAVLARDVNTGDFRTRGGALAHGPAKSILLTDEITTLALDVMANGRPGSHVVLTPEPSFTVFLPVVATERQSFVLLAGHLGADPIPHEWLDAYLALVGLAGTVVDRLRAEQKIAAHEAYLEEVVRQRTADLAAAERQNETDRRQTEEALTEARERLAVTLRSIGDAVIATDTNGRVTLVNRAVEELTGWSQVEAEGKSLFEIFRIIDENTGLPAADPVRAVCETGSVVGLSSHAALLSRDGAVHAVADTAAPILGPRGDTRGVVLVFRDVTEARQAKLERDATVELFRILHSSATGPELVQGVTRFFENQSRCDSVRVRLQGGRECPYYQSRLSSGQLQDGAGRHDVHTTGATGDYARGEIFRCTCGYAVSGVFNRGGTFFTSGGTVWMNKRTPRFRSEGEEDVPGDAPVCDVEAFESSAFFPLRSGGECLGLLELKDRRKDRFSSVEIQAYERLVGHVAPALGKLRAEEAVRASEAALRDADRRKDEFLAVLSHELRNPLAPIRQSLYIMDRVPPGAEQARKAQEIIERQVGHLTRLVDDLLDVTRINRGKIRIQRDRLELGELVRRTIEDHRQTFVTSGIQFDWRFPSEPIWLNADRTRIAQVVGNLLGNAAKFTSAGGRVDLTLERDATTAVLRVQDTGEGITPDMLERLFQPFSQAGQTLARSRGGLGLGLALVKWLVELHGGSVAASSKGTGQGAEFTVRIPIADVAGQEALLGAGNRTGRHRLLVIEDNLDAAESLKQALELMGHHVAVAHDGLQGLVTALEFRPDLLLCDIGLPEVDGFEVARRFLADPQLRRVVLVALTGYARPEDRRRAVQAGYTRLLAKPLTVEALERVLDELLGSFQTEMESV
jgi:PAS domain S-box-containing protein